MLSSSNHLAFATRCTVEYTKRLTDWSGWLAAVVVQFVNLMGAFLLVESPTLEALFLLGGMTLVVIVAAQYTITLADEFLQQVDDHV